MNMEYRLDFNSIEKHFKFDEGEGINTRLRHENPVKIKIFPYDTKKKSQDFNSIMGLFSRLISNCMLNNNFQEFNLNDVIDDVLSKVETKDNNAKTKLRNIINDLFFEDSQKIEYIHPSIYNYIPVKQHKILNKKIAYFLYDTLDAKRLQEDVKKSYELIPNNILLKLIFDSLPKLEKRKNKNEFEFRPVLPFVTEMFLCDFKFMLSDAKLFVAHYEHLLKYYYYYYVSQLVVKLSQMFDADLSKPEPIYFTLDWESSSRSRTSFHEGWKLLDNCVAKMFTHVNCLEFLNHHQGDDSKTFTYVEINQNLVNMNEEQRNNFKNDVASLIKQYTSRINDVSMEHFTESEPKDACDAIKILFNAIDYQFYNSSRKKQYKNYSKMFDEFCKNYFLKARGPLGHTLNMTQGYLLLITRLCIGNNNKMRLKDLFREYEKRGLFLDSDSKQKVIKLLETLNLLEKKSDSGDAQYVRSIL